VSMSQRELKPKCCQCKFFEEKELQKHRGPNFPDGSGRCKRFPKEVEKNRVDWCGEFKRIDPPELMAVGAEK